MFMQILMDIILTMTGASPEVIVIMPAMLIMVLNMLLIIMYQPKSIVLQTMDRYIPCIDNT